ncbi:hypothetical protein EN851_07860 [Mesorhizobium sp. M8A.F.Ca.ET.208.01.1.1]|uniref:hypothetical protein n=1 Tax=unclassified Mesorhizobium TaxID=325217 RepID=UPI0010937541|nr:MULTISPECIES: hypothetical protein [unclassified Mesorhizobium]TGQ95424.1 hypothetical protein EN851_07860 [Mesorhizobium sp. M8A.F.Ca.ET.208.01.1.1]TGT55915.1 hypothetical protein EN810_07860 [Mesorhizobium sp. M8A.F.Ca.ET.167.01.1.1]
MWFFAWVDETETTFGLEHQVEDEEIVSISLTHKEGAFASLDITVKNPRTGLLAPGRKQWAWLSWQDENNPTAGVVPLLFGRLVGVPQAVQGNAVTLNLLARPSDYDALKRALAETMKVAPNWDPMFFNADSRDDPDTVLEGYTKAWHIGRADLGVTASDILDGEDGLIEFGDAFIRESLSIDPGEPPLTSIKVSAEINWAQAATGTVDFTRQLVTAFTTAGSGNGYAIQSLTGDGLMQDFPQRDDRLGGGWTFGDCTITRTDGFVVPQDYHQIVMTNGTGQFPVWTMKPVFVVDYDVSRKRQETVSFTLVADCQAILTDPEGQEVTEVKVSGDADEPVDEATTDFPDGAPPIVDVRKRAYLTTERGRRSIDFLVCLGRRKILERSRAVQISFSAPLTADLAETLSCRCNAHIVDPRIPGGAATGKIVGYAITASNGSPIASVTIGCTVGKGNTFTTVPGDPAYVEEGYVEDGYQAYLGRTVMPVAGEITLSEDYLLIPPNDDGVDFLAMEPATLVEQITIINPLPTQAAVLGAFQPDLSAAIEALNQVFTEVDGDLKVLKGGPFITDYPLEVSALAVPKTIDLEAA